MRSLGQLYAQYGEVENQLRALEKQKIKTRLNQLTISEGSILKKNHYSDSRLPAVQAGGRKIEHTSPFKVDLKNDESALKLPLYSQRLRGKLKYFSIPKKDNRVFLRAETRNSTQLPILSGAAQIFMNGDLVSKTQLNTVSEGGYFTVDLGVDENIQTKRIVKKTSEEKGLVFKDHSTRVDVTLEVVNNHSFSIELTLKDHYPLSPLKKEIKIELVQQNPKAKRVSKGKILEWLLKIPAKKKRKVQFSYRVTHPKDYLVSEFN